METVKKSKMPLKRSLLIELCIKDSSVLEFIIRAFNSMKTLRIKNSTMFSFVTYTIVEFIVALPVVTDNNIRQILPLLIDGLASSNVEFRSGMLIVTGVLSKKILFEVDMFNSIVEAISKGIDESSVYDALLCLVQLYQSQKVETFPQSALARIITQPTIKRHLNLILEKFTCGDFIVPLSYALLDAAFEGNQACQNLLVSLIRCVDIPKECVYDIVGHIIKRLSVQKSMVGLEILREIHCQRFAQVDKALNDTLTNFQGTKTERREFYSVMSNVFSGSASETMPSINTTLFLALQHTEPRYRLLAITRLAEILSEPQNESYKDLLTFIEPILLDRLNDTGAIVNAILELPELVNVIDPKSLASSLSSIIIRMESPTTHIKAITQSLILIGGNKDLESKELIHAIFGSLLYTCNFCSGKDSLDWVTRVLGHVGVTKINSIQEMLLDENLDASTRNMNVLQEIVTKVSEGLPSTYNVQFFQNGLTSNNTHMRIFSSLVLNRAIYDANVTDLDVFEQYLHLLGKHFSWPGFKTLEFDSSLLAMTKGFPNGVYLKQIKHHNAAKFEGALFIISFACLIAKCPRDQATYWMSSQVS